MVDDHKRRGVGGEIFDAVANLQEILAEYGADLARHLEILEKNFGLAHLTADAQDVVLALPAGLDPDVFGGDIG